jgi:polar amino acid transport system substrate-binding protein
MRGIVPIACVLMAVVGTGCGDDARSDMASALDALAQSVPTTSQPASDGPATTTTTSPSERECLDRELATASLRPEKDALASAALAGGTVAEIRARGHLRVGVDENTLGFSARNPATGDIEGFEVDLATAIAARIFGDDGTGRVDPVPVVTDEKFEVVEDGLVDMTISANSMKCDRWEQVAFSTEYYTAHQQFLVRRDSPVRTVDDLAGATVCVTVNSSSSKILEAQVPEAEIAPEPDRTGCLLALQQGEVDAYFGHDSFLYGMKPQDPTVEILPDLLPLEETVSHYGIAISHDHPDLVRFVNAVLAEIRADGTWADLHKRLEDELGLPPADPPTARYRD